MISLGLSKWKQLYQAYIWNHFLLKLCEAELIVRWRQYSLASFEKSYYDMYQFYFRQVQLRNVTAW